MQIAVYDAARAASNSVGVLVTNLTARRGSTNLLHTSGNYGWFTGAVATVTGAAGAGQIQIASGDNLEGGLFRLDRNEADCDRRGRPGSKAINSVSSFTDVGVLTITWVTSEPATSIVHYGTNSSNLNLGYTNLVLVTNHVVKLTRLIPGRTYYFSVVSPTPPATRPRTTIPAQITLSSARPHRWCCWWTLTIPRRKRRTVRP